MKTFRSGIVFATDAASGTDLPTSCRREGSRSRSKRGVGVRVRVEKESEIEVGREARGLERNQELHESLILTLTPALRLP